MKEDLFRVTVVAGAAGVSWMACLMDGSGMTHGISLENALAGLACSLAETEKESGVELVFSENSDSRFPSGHWYATTIRGGYDGYGISPANSLGQLINAMAGKK